MIFVILASFVICWCPFHIEKLMEITSSSQTIDQTDFLDDIADGPVDPCNTTTNGTAMFQIIE